MGKNLDPLEISNNFNQVCLLFGIKGQTCDDLLQDIEIAKKHFNRICINIFNENSTPLKRDENLIKWFVSSLYSSIKDDNNIDILIENTDFGVGGI